MITLFRTAKTYSLDQAKELLAKQIRQLPQMISPIGTPCKILRFEFNCHPGNLLNWLHNQKNKEKTYWSDRNQDFEMAGIGSADCLQKQRNFDYKEIFEYIEDHLSADNPNLRYYGGLCFNQNSHDHEWEKYGTCRFIVPRFELLHQTGKLIFACNINVKDIATTKISEILSALEAINPSFETIYRKTPQMIQRTDLPNFDQWRDAFSKIAGQKGGYSFNKIVLARRSTFQFDIDIRPSALMKHLKAQTPNCFHFCFQIDKHNAFLGATPERLYKIKGSAIKSEAVAGTTRRGESEEENQQQEHNLLNSPKYIQEHKFVVDAIHDAFKNLCTHYESDERPSLLKLSNGQHLITRFKGELTSGAANPKILRILHPTPAVAGTDRSQVVDAIRDIEPFSRGWYAGPVGYVGYDTTEFAVAIRSGLIDNNNLSLYAGAGIVKGSTEQDEWAEIENKISRFMKVFEKG